jgi:DNA-directed RNA polymerase specialized sigma24 family protein
MELTETITESPGLRERESLFLDLYERAFPHTARFVGKMGGSLEDAKDIFQDALVIYYEKSLQPLFITRLSAEAYILGIAKHLWIRKFRQHAQHGSLSAGEDAISIPEDYFPAVNDKKLLVFLERSGKKCMDLLRVFYYDNLSMKKVASALGYATDRSATVQKYKCLEKVRDTIKDKSLGYEDFLE